MQRLSFIVENKLSKLLNNKIYLSTFDKNYNYCKMYIVLQRLQPFVISVLYYMSILKLWLNKH